MRNILIVLFSIIFFSFFVTVPSIHAQTCTTPTTPQSVKITYPNCTETTCSFTDASCSWEAITDAATYTVKVTEVDTNTIITTQSIPTGTLKLTFPVTAGKTYKCDVTPVNSCGTAGGTGSHQLLCNIDAIGITTTTAPAIGAPVVQPTLPPSGMVENTLLITGVSIIFLIAGAAFLLL